LIYLKNLERAIGIEPTTYSLGSCRSTTELRPQNYARKTTPGKLRPQNYARNELRPQTQRLTIAGAARIGMSLAAAPAAPFADATEIS
jgi:hypothetical protein